MRLLIAKCVVSFVFLVPVNALAQSLVRSNPVETGLIYNWNSKITNNISNQTKYMSETAAIQATMSTEFGEMKSWERKYNNYLKEARGYAEALKAGSTLFCEGVRTFISLANIEKAVSANPQGIAATFAINDMYVEAAVEMIKAYRLIDISVGKGGVYNMLNGAERTQLLWMINEQLASMNRKFHQLALSIAFYNIKDVWLQKTSGLIERDHAEIARQSLDRWKRAQKVSSLF